MKNIIKYITSFIFLFWFLYISETFSDYTGFTKQISQYNFDINQFSQLQNVPRYDVVRLLNYSECQDCTFPSQWYLNKFTWEWFLSLQKTPGNFFGDIKTNIVDYKWDNIYYCISYVADKNYMNGYVNTSPSCPGDFCGERSITYAELIQIMSNITAEHYTGKYSINRYTVNSWIKTIKTSNPIVYQNFDLLDLSNISSGSKENRKLIISTRSQLQTYIKYCTYNPKDCGFVEFDNIKSWQRPIADYNFLINEGILSRAEANSINIHKFPSGQDILKYIYRMYSKTQCSFNDDYDWDGTLNRNDIDPFTDNSYKGTIYTGKNINTNTWSNTWNNTWYNIPENLGSLQIIATPLICELWKQATVIPYWSGNIDQIARDMNSEYYIANQVWRVYYDCNSVWQKVFTAKSYYKNKRIWISRANIYVISGNNNTSYASNLMADKLVAKVDQEICFSTVIRWFTATDVSRVDWNMMQDDFTNNNLNICYDYDTTGKKIIVQDIYLHNWYKLQDAVTVYIRDENWWPENPPPVNPKCTTPQKCPSFDRLNSINFGDKVRAILVPQSWENRYNLTNWHDITRQ